ncbi:30S ribosomal protein S17 [Candidatus Nitrosacidococcus sp. I8]|uniref:30S ribosomal protein S17 n=1 Tax=Candidatus Nitrosacidococcus sp. I8 TaxID=2942908 RepID=UPI002226429D|nr:30S ribosomal protein S17 [Candidatus Nitrosacidococcus sp. I8]CAH9017320.1 30S ribosomal protein S17 [Candidatus Nitrosacidococcus sp. I8]
MNNENFRTITGQVVSNRMDKTITVVIERKIPHPLYKKYIRRSNKLHAHDENNDCAIGDTVSITSVKPLSKTKSWQLVSILERAR